MCAAIIWARRVNKVKRPHPSYNHTYNGLLLYFSRAFYFLGQQMAWRDLAQVSLRLSWWLAAKGMIILDVEKVRVRIKIAMVYFRLVELRSKWWWWWWWWCLQWWRKGEGQSKERNGDSLNVSGALLQCKLHLFQVTMTGLPLQTLLWWWRSLGWWWRRWVPGDII